MTGHGFRQLASTGLYELQFSENLIEIQLAHLEQSSVKKRYDLSAHLAERQVMMTQWANHLDDLRAGKAVRFDLLEPDELDALLAERNQKVNDLVIYQKDILIRNLRAQGVTEEVLLKLAEQL